MPDIRQSTETLDDFERPNEDPIQTNTTAGPWNRTSSIREAAAIVSGALTHRLGFGFQGGESYYTDLVMDGDEAEFWGNATGGGGGAGGAFWSISLWANAGDGSGGSGYRFRREESGGGGGFYMYRWDNGAITGIGTPNGTGMMPYILLRRNGGDVEAWGSHDLDTWILLVSASDSNYTTDLRGGLGAGDNGGGFICGWQYVGGGEDEWVPQIYRRPNE